MRGDLLVPGSGANPLQDMNLCKNYPCLLSEYFPPLSAIAYKKAAPITIDVAM
jgi:hypothetical protein